MHTNPCQHFCRRDVRRSGINLYIGRYVGLRNTEYQAQSAT
jgi:hypothetical protein